mgnify:CR=1 FL=1
MKLKHLFRENVDWLLIMVNGEHYKGFVRLNLATDPKYVQKAMNNIVKAVQELK